MKFTPVILDIVQVVPETPNKAMKRTLDRDLLSLPLHSAALKRRLSRR
jgi:hypothetical protein